jgi:hypothetical protein
LAGSPGVYSIFEVSRLAERLSNFSALVAMRHGFFGFTRSYLGDVFGGVAEQTGD